MPMKPFIKLILIAGVICGVSPVMTFASNSGEGEVIISNKTKNDKDRDEVPVVNYDEEKETLTVSFENMTYQGLVTITVTNVLDGTSQTCVHSTTEEAMECAMSNAPGSYQILIVTDDGTEYEGYFTI